MHQLTVQIGRSTGSTDDVQVEDLDDDTLIRAARLRCEQVGGIGNALALATQVLIWDADRPDNLIAVYAIRENKLTMM